MQKIIIYIGFICSSLITNAQELPIYNQYLVDPYIVNPAYAGSYDYSYLSANIFQQNLKLEGSPKTYLLSYHTPYQLARSTKSSYSRYKKKSKIGFGGLLYNDINGPFNNLGLQLTFSYRLNLNRDGSNFFSLGLSPTISNFQINKSYFQVALDDPALNNLYSSRFVPDLNFGVLFKIENLRCGLAAYRLFESPINLHSKNDSNQLNTTRSYFINIGYQYKFGDLTVEPSLADELNESRISELSDKLQVNLMCKYNIIAMGISYRIKSSISIIGGLNFDDYCINLGYTHYTSMYALGGVEVSVGYKFNEIRNTKPRRTR